MRAVVLLGVMKIQGGAKVGLQLFHWKITQQLINGNIRINAAFQVLPTGQPNFAPPCILKLTVVMMHNQNPMDVHTLWCAGHISIKVLYRGHDKPKLMGTGTDVYTAEQIPSG